MGVDAGAADLVLREVEPDHPAAVHPVDDTADLTHDLGADAVAGQHQQLLVGGHEDISFSRGPGRRSRRDSGAEPLASTVAGSQASAGLPLLVAVDRERVLQGLADIIQTIQERMLAEGIDRRSRFLRRSAGRRPGVRDPR